MSRRVRGIMAGLLAIALASPSSGQFGQWGWGGWDMGGTVEGHALHGGGLLAQGLGLFNLNTAQANSVNADTVMRMNEYMWQSTQIAQRNYFERVAARKARRNETLGMIEQRLLYDPSSADVLSGDSMNAMLRQLQNPVIPTSLVSHVGNQLTLSGAALRTIPFKFASQGAIVSVERLTATNRWPLPLLSEEFRPDRDAFARLVAEAKAIPDDQSIPDELILRGISAVSAMRDKARSRLTGPEFGQAERYLRGLVGMLQMARQPNIKEVLEKAASIEKLPVGTLINFMDAYNLEFGVARTTEEQSLYRQALHPMIRQVRDYIERELGARVVTGTQQARRNDPSKSPTELLDTLPWERLSAAVPGGGR